MQYTEILPDDVFSRHVESHWQLSSCSGNKETPLKLLLPTCTFNIIFTDQPCFIKSKMNADWTFLPPGAAFFGQRNSCIHIKFEKSLNLCGIRFKPFAFAHIINTPIFKLNDEFAPLDQLFVINASTFSLIQQIIETRETVFKLQLLNDFTYSLLKNSLSIDETLRAQLNYIMDRRGSARVSELFEEFKVSKVTLRKHFINKVGLTPKKVSQIWRMNYLFQMKEDYPEKNLTVLCLEAGFYDQAHFIKDFKLLFGVPPREFFKQNTHLIKVAHQNISRRFTNQYDPK